MLTLGWFSTGRGEGSRGLLTMTLEAIERGDLNARIDYVFCNRDPGEHPGSDEFMALVESSGLPLVTLSSQRFRLERNAPSFAAVRKDFDRAVIERLTRYKPQICVLAGYMLIVGGEMCRRYTMLNLHPALPSGPVGTWQQVIWKLVQSRASETGATIHLATEALDQGPVVAYASFPLHTESFERLWRQVRNQSVEQMKGEEGEEPAVFKRIRREGMRRERPLLLETLKALAEGRIQLADRRLQDPHGASVQGLCLNAEVEASLAQELESGAEDDQ